MNWSGSGKTHRSACHQGITARVLPACLPAALTCTISLGVVSSKLLSAVNLENYPQN